LDQTKMETLYINMNLMLKKLYNFIIQGGYMPKKKKKKKNKKKKKGNKKKKRR